MSGIGLPKGMSRDDAYIQGIADTEDRIGKASEGLYDALKVITEDQRICNWLVENDIKALSQAVNALVEYERAGLPA